MAPFVVLATRLSLPPQLPFNEMTVTGLGRRPGDQHCFTRQCRVHGAQREIDLHQGGGDSCGGQHPHPTGGAAGRAPPVRRRGVEAHAEGISGNAEEDGGHHEAGDEPADSPRQLII